MKGPTLRAAGRHLAKLALTTVTAARITEQAARAVYQQIGGHGLRLNIDELTNTLDALSGESMEIDRRLHDLSLDEERDEQQMAELQAVVDALTRSLKVELASIRAQLECVVGIVGPEAVQAGLRTASKDALQRSGDVDGTNWRGMRGRAGAVVGDQEVHVVTEQITRGAGESESDWRRRVRKFIGAPAVDDDGPVPTWDAE